MGAQYSRAPPDQPGPILERTLKSPSKGPSEPVVRPVSIPADDPPPPPDTASTWRTGKRKKKVTEWPQELTDSVKNWNLAYRLKKGHLVWTSLVGSMKRKSRVSHGASLICLTQHGAHRLRYAMDAWNPEHFDILLRSHAFLLGVTQYLQLRNARKRLSAGFGHWTRPL